MYIFITNPTGHGLNQPIYSYHVTQASRNRVKLIIFLLQTLQFKLKKHPQKWDTLAYIAEFLVLIHLSFYSAWYLLIRIACFEWKKSGVGGFSKILRNF